MAVVIGIEPYVDRFSLILKMYDNKTTKLHSSHEPSYLQRLFLRNDVCQLPQETRREFKEGSHEETPRLHIGFKFIGGDRNPGFGKCITTEATDGIR